MEKKVASSGNEELRKKVIKKTKGEIFKCFNCGVCAASCSVSQIRDFNPRRILRKLVLGLDLDEDVWTCVSCYMCNARCPNGIDVAKIMDVLRIESQKRGEAEKNRIAIFNKAFLNSIEKGGRLYEIGMLAKYKLTSGDLLGDAELGLPMMLRGKIGMIPHNSGNTKEVREIFKKVREIDNRDG